MQRILNVGCVVLVLFGGFPLLAAADEEEIQARLQAIRKQREALRQQEQGLLKQEQELLTQLAQARGKNAGSIKVEATGVLRVENGRGYFISVRSARDLDRENVVWLRVSEDKVRVQKLQGLLGKRVLVKGELQQLPADTNASVPPLGMYLDHFEIQAAEPVKE